MRITKSRSISRLRARSSPNSRDTVPSSADRGQPSAFHLFKLESTIGSSRGHWSNPPHTAGTATDRLERFDLRPRRLPFSPVEVREARPGRKLYEPSPTPAIHAANERPESRSYAVTYRSRV